MILPQRVHRTTMFVDCISDDEPVQITLSAAEDVPNQINLLPPYSTQDPGIANVGRSYAATPSNPDGYVINVKEGRHPKFKMWYRELDAHRKDRIK